MCDQQGNGAIDLRFDIASHIRRTSMSSRPAKALRLLVSGYVITALVLFCAQAQYAQTSTQQRQSIAQARLQEQVRRDLVTQPFYTVFDNLAFKVDGDRVTLLGQVVSPTLKLDAATAVKSIEGVSAVDNQIEVLPVSPSDAQIRRAEFRAIYSYPGMEKYAIQAVPPIHIIVKNGHVTLVGVVANNMDKTLANIRAKTVSGVFSVTNQLTVEK
jgi:osmotically-inducible protein OsmY